MLAYAHHSLIIVTNAKNKTRKYHAVGKSLFGLFRVDMQLKVYDYWNTNNFVHMYNSYHPSLYYSPVIIIIVILTPDAIEQEDTNLARAQEDLT